MVLSFMAGYGNMVIDSDFHVIKLYDIILPQRHDMTGMGR